MISRRVGVGRRRRSPRPPPPVSSVGDREGRFPSVEVGGLNEINEKKLKKNEERIKYAGERCRANHLPCFRPVWKIGFSH